MKINRVVVATLLIVLAVTFYEVRLKPQSRPLYERGLALYRQQRYAQSLLELERAYHIEPNSTAILVLRGWNHLKLRQYHDARENFARAARLDPELVEAQLGLAYVTLETGRGDASLAGVGALLKGDPSNPDFRLAAAVALRKSGKNSEAAEIFAQLLGSGRYRDVARRNLVEMYGLDGLDESLPQGLPELQRPAELQMQFKTSGSYFQHRTNAGWAPLYVKGVNLTVAQPGRFPSEPPHRADVYQDWLGRIAQMSANTVRAYTILPPAFYRALRKHNSDAQRPRLYLIQQVWLPDTEATNLFTSVATEAAKAQIRAAVDAIHGRGDVPPRQGAGGLYTADVAEYTIAFIVGRPMEPSEVLSNNELNSFRDSHDGKFVAVRNGNPTEVWLASMADFAAEFETENYNHQRPVGLANWAALDPLTHRSEASLSEEVAFRRNMGERAASVPEGPINDNDSVSIDETRFISGASFRAGLFSAYSVFPFYPDFMYREPAFSRTRDAEGPNPFFGYLKVLKSHYKDLPILATDYGASSSIGVSRLHPLGWRQGGLTERRQGELLARMTRNIADAQLAGGLVSGWQDEWRRTSWVAAPLAVPAERRPMWNDRLDPDQGFGLWTYDPSRHKQFFASTAGWRSVEPIYQKAAVVASLNDGWDAERTLRSLSAASDEAFVYIRLATGRVRKGRVATPDMAGASYYIGISTAPDRFGSQTLPGLTPLVRVEEAFNFLLYVAGGRARLLIASNYNPRADGSYRIPFGPRIEKFSPFEDIVVETNRRRFSRDGAMFPPQRHDYSDLAYGAPDQLEDTLASWTCDFDDSAMIFRIPWALLLVTDPSSRQVLAGAAERTYKTIETPGLQLFAVSFRPAGSVQFHYSMGVTSAFDSLPERESAGRLAGLKTYRWPTWNAVNVQGRTKAGYAILQKVFRELKGPLG